MIVTSRKAASEDTVMVPSELKSMSLVTSMTAALVLVIAFTNSLAVDTEVESETDAVATFDSPNCAVEASELAAAKKLAVLTAKVDC